MFEWWKKFRRPMPEEDYEGIVLHEYEGQVISSEYNVKDPDHHPYHVLVPHGYGRIKYIYSGEVVEEYEGNFHGGQYSGEGKLTKNGKVYEGDFEENKFVK